MEDGRWEDGKARVYGVPILPATCMKHGTLCITFLYEQKVLRNTPVAAIRPEGKLLNASASRLGPLGFPLLWNSAQTLTVQRLEDRGSQGEYVETRQ